MSEQKAVEPGKEAITGEEAIDLIDNTLGNFLSTANVYAAYGEPIEKGDTLIIPSAEVFSLMGFGVGSGYGGNEEEGGGSGSGGGGGGRAFSRPVAVIVASPEGVRVDPVVDVTKVALAALTAGAFMTSMFLRLLNPKKALKDMQEGKFD